MRIIFIDNEMTRNNTKITIFDRNGQMIRNVDMRWEDFMVVDEYDSEKQRN